MIRLNLREFNFWQKLQKPQNFLLRYYLFQIKRLSLYACDLIFRSLEADIDYQHELNDQALQNVSLDYPNNNRSPSKRKKNKSIKKSYDFREYGVDARRRGAKHQRRKQNCKRKFELKFIYDFPPVFR